MAEHILTAIIISTLLVFITSAIFYEALCITLRIIAKHDLRTRPLMFFLVAAIFSAHTTVIWIYGVTYWTMVHSFGFEPLSGIAHDSFFGYIYFSAATYSSLGIGDVFPHGAMQFMTGVQVLNGLILIGWSIMVTYFSVQKLWDIHGIGGPHECKGSKKQ
tara:strand:+ start:13991 stop:14470 length:480 start_codon:yes stop_codon:yes gene_type:complete